MRPARAYAAIMAAISGRMVPAAATVYGRLMELPNLRTVNPVGRIAGFNLSAFDRFRNPAAHRQIALASQEHKALSDPFLIAEFDFAAPPAGANWREITIPITASVRSRLNDSLMD